MSESANQTSPPVILIKDPDSGRVWYVPTEGMPAGLLDPLLLAEIKRLRKERAHVLRLLHELEARHRGTNVGGSIGVLAVLLERGLLSERCSMTGEPRMMGGPVEIPGEGIT